MAYFILSLDGGGVRGVLTARLLERLDDEFGFLKDVQLFAGTSTGGILALGLAAGIVPKDLVAFYADHADVVFASRDLLDQASGPADELLRADYSTEPLCGVLKAVFDGIKPNLTLGDLRRNVLIPTFDLDNGAKPPESRHWKPKFLHNYPGEGSDARVLVVDAALRTSAAPTYFPTYQGFVDGGVVANNPSMCAAAKALKEGVPCSEICLLSVGTGFNPHAVRGSELDWGKTQWIPRLIPMLFDGMPGVAHYQCEHVLGPSYHRLDLVLDQVIGLDEVTRIDTLLKVANQQSAAFDRAREFLRERWLPARGKPVT